MPTLALLTTMVPTLLHPRRQCQQQQQQVRLMHMVVSIQIGVTMAPLSLLATPF